ncbi:AsmA family protein [Labilibacter sediminis]|nr:AsmA family protein [Labilibacter sediminis]
MKRFLKIFGGFITVLFVLLLIVPFFFKGKIERIVKEQVNNQLNATVDWSKFSLSLISSFPDLSVGMTDLTVVGEGKFEEDTLLYLKDFDLSADLFTAIGGKGIEVTSIMFDQPIIQAKVLADSTANWDIAKATAEAQDAQIDENSESTDFTINLQRLEVKDAIVKYHDHSMDLYTGIIGFNLDLSGDFSAISTDLNINSSIEKLNLTMEETQYLNEVKIGFKAEVLADLVNNIFTFKENDFTINKLNLGFDGSVAMLEEGYELDVKLGAKETNFKSLLELVPQEYRESMEDIDVQGTLALNAVAKGIYTDADHLPSFNAVLRVGDGQIKYPDLPKSIDNININVVVENAGGSADNTITDLKEFHFDLGGNPFDADFLLKTPVSNPQFKGSMVGIIDLNSLKDAIPLDSFDIKGVINADVSLNGNMAMIEQEKYDSVDVRGDIKLEGFYYSSVDMPQAVLIQDALMSFSPKKIALEKLNCIVGSSDFSLHGKIENYLAYVFKDETLYGVLKHKSKLLDVNELMISEETESDQSVEDSIATMELYVVPKNFDFVFSSSFDKIKYDKLEINNAQGKVTVRNGKVVLDGIAMDLLDGEMIMAGEYNTQNENKPFVDFLFNASSIDINKTANSFSVVDSLMPIAKKSKGKISASLKYNSLLDQQMSPVIPSITGSGNIKSKAIEVSDSKVLNNMADLLKKDEYRKMKAEDINIDFVMKDGKIIVAPFTTRVFGKSITVAGEQGFDQSLNYVVRAPISRKEVAGAMSFLADFSDKGDDIIVDVIVKGTAKDPKLSMDLTEAKKQVQKEVEKEAKKAIEDAMKDENVKKTVDELKKKLGGFFK